MLCLFHSGFLRNRSGPQSSTNNTASLASKCTLNKWTVLRDRASRPGCTVLSSLPSLTACVLRPPTRSDALPPTRQARGPAAHPRQPGSRSAGEAFPGSAPARKRRAWLRNFTAAVVLRLLGGACDPKTGKTRIPPGTPLPDLRQHNHPRRRTSCWLKPAPSAAKSSAPPSSHSDSCCGKTKTGFRIFLGCNEDLMLSGRVPGEMAQSRNPSTQEDQKFRATFICIANLKTA